MQGGRGDERGSVAVFTAVVMVIILAFAAFAVDLGTQRVARRDMQALADVVALDAARLLDGRTAQQVRAGSATQPTLVTATRDSQARNDSGVLGNPGDLKVTPYLVALRADGTWAKDAQGLPVEVAATAIPRAVVVLASTRVDFGFAKVLGVSSGGANREAAASRTAPSICFSVGTKALALDTTGSTLSPLLNQVLKVNLAAVGYEGLVNLQNASVPVAGLLAQLNVGSVDQLATTNVGLAQLVVAAARAASANGDTVTATALNALQLGVAGTAVNLASILALQSGTDVAGLSSQLNVLDLVTAGVIAANGQNAITLALPGLTDVRIVEPPRIACGARGASATSAQVNLRLKPTLLGNAGLGLVGGSTDLTVQLAKGTATIDADLTCAPESVTLKVVTGAAVVLAPVSPAYGQVQLAVTLSKFLSFLGGISTVTSLALGVLGLDQVLLDVLVTGSAASTTETRTITFPTAPALPPPLVVPSNGTGATLTLAAAGVQLSPGQNASLLGLLTPLLNGALSAVLGGLVVPIVNTVVSPALTAVLNPVLNLLGLKLGVVDVRMLGRPVCNGVRLIG